MQTIAVLLMAYGSPENLDELEPYLLDIRGGRPTTPALVVEMRQRYQQIGGRSPLLEITRTQAAALQAAWEIRHGKNGLRFKTYVGMRHWQPRIADAVSQISADGITSIIGFVMAPHQSRLSTGAYFSKLDEACANLSPAPEIIRIESWHDHPAFIAALAEKAHSALLKFEAQPFVLFSAHSLPARLLQEGDPYQPQLLETAALLAQRLSLPSERWSFCFQSAGRSLEPWMGPSIEDALVELAKKGEKDVLVIPVGFVCDHVEVLYDLDIAARRLAVEKGIHLERSESLNASPAFISALADILWSSWESYAARSAQPATGEASRT
jgi:ferrochelatase